MADNYDSEEEFGRDAATYISTVFMQTEPFRANIDKLNFYRVYDPYQIGCTTDSYVRCDDFAVQQIAVRCPNDYIFVLHKRSEALDTINPVRSSSIGNVAYVNTADDKYVAIHEFGHIFAKLADEYVDDEFYSGFDAQNTPNCDAKGCRKWARMTSECYPGCTTSGYFRGTLSSIMRDYYSSHEFGSINSKVINSSIEVYG